MKEVPCETSLDLVIMRNIGWQMHDIDECPDIKETATTLTTTPSLGYLDERTLPRLTGVRDPSSQLQKIIEPEVFVIFFLQLLSSIHTLS